RRDGWPSSEYRRGYSRIWLSIFGGWERTFRKWLGDARRGRARHRFKVAAKSTAAREAVRQTAAARVVRNRRIAPCSLTSLSPCSPPAPPTPTPGRTSRRSSETGSASGRASRERERAAS